MESNFTTASTNVSSTFVTLTAAAWTNLENMSTTAGTTFLNTSHSFLESAGNSSINSANISQTFSDISTDLFQISVAGSEAANSEHSKGAFYAWIGLGILLVGIVFILGFVFLFDKFLRKKFFGRSTTTDPEADRSKADQDQTDNGKKPTDMVIGEPNLPTETQKKSDETEKNGSSESLSKRKRQEKVDETNEVELKPL